MATNSSVFSGSSVAKWQVLHLVFNRGSQDVANNRTNFSYEAYIQGTGGGSGSTTAGSYSITGATTKSASGQSWSWNTTTKQTIATGSFYVSHNSDGTLATQTLNISASFISYGDTLTANTSVSLTVPTIPRASQPSLNVSTQALGSAITISTNRASTSFTHTLTYAFGNQSGTIATGVETSQSWTLPVGLANAIPNAPSGVGTIYVDTFNGSTHIGKKSIVFTATVPNNSTFKPTATISSIVEGASLPSGITAFVRNISKAKVTSTGAGKYSATIKTYSVSVAGIGTYTGSVITSAFLKNSGSVKVTLTVTDSRGLKGSTNQDINVIAYSPPKISTFKASRSESNLANISVSYNASISSVSSQNYKRFRIRSKASDGSWVVKTDSTQNYTFSGTETIASNADKSYTIEFFVQDSFTSITQTVQVGTAFTLLDFNASGKGMAIGKVSESDSFEVGMPTQLNVNVAEVLSLRRIGSDKNTVMSFQDDTMKRYFGFSMQGNPKFSESADVNSTGHDFWHSGNQAENQFPNTAQAIGASQNLNNYTTPGFYYQSANANASTSLNYPEARAGTLIVTKDAGTTQMYYEYSGRGIFYRTYYNSWSSWRTLYHSGNLPPHQIESGSEPTGEYVKYPDGTMICWARRNLGNAAATNGQVYDVWVYPQPFVGIPSVTFTPEMVTTGSGNALQVRFGMGNVESHQARAGIENNNASQRQFYANWHAIGRWK